jgi:hypothetical protein
VDILRFNTWAAIGFLCFGIAIGAMSAVTTMRTVPWWVRTLIGSVALTVLVWIIVVLAIANPVAGGG